MAVWLAPAAPSYYEDTDWFDDIYQAKTKQSIDKTCKIPYFFQLNPRGLVFLEGLKSGLYWNEGYIRMRVAVY